MNLLANYTVEDLFCSRARVKILRELALKGELIITKIIENTRLKHSSVMKHLVFLLDIGYLDKRQYGRIKIYRFKEENIIAHSIKNLIDFFENGAYPNVEELFYSKFIVRIIKTLVLYDSLNISDIIKYTNSNSQIIKKHLDFLTELRFLIAKKFGKIRIFYYNNENNGANLVKNLIRLLDGKSKKILNHGFSEV